MSESYCKSLAHREDSTNDPQVNHVLPVFDFYARHSQTVTCDQSCSTSGLCVLGSTTSTAKLCEA